jgi:AraC-like DNA-binding protein
MRALGRAAPWETADVEDTLVLTRRTSERGVHETAQRAAGPSNAVVRHAVGYEEWERAAFLRRETARHGVALILGFGDSMEVFEGEADSPVRTLGAFVVGNQSRSSLTGIRGHQLGAQVELTSAGALEVFGNIEDLNDAVVPLDEALGRRGTNLLERLSETPTWAARFELIDEAFDRSEPKSFCPEVEWLRQQLVASKGRARVEPLMDETGWSRRHVTERFRRQLGIPPKAYARLLRFEHATSLLSDARAGRTLAAVATEAGYYDQSHLNREFVDLAGMTPGVYAAGCALVPEVRFVQDDPVASRSK